MMPVFIDFKLNFTRFHFFNGFRDISSYGSRFRSRHQASRTQYFTELTQLRASYLV